MRFRERGCGLKNWGWIVLGIAGLSAQAQAWSRHDLITQAALNSLPVTLKNRPLRVTSLDQLIHDLGFESLDALKKNLKIAPSLTFPFKIPQAQERVGKTVLWAKVLSTYADEPDWGMDQELFDPYPELWGPELSMMGGKTGAPSQAFRHMFWPFQFRSFVTGMKLPLSKFFKSMGHAPDRAELWLLWSRRAAKKGHPYWATRFLANALHYLEDVTQPFHTAQTPSKWFLMLPAFRFREWSTASEWVVKVTRIITYYHFAYEDGIGKILDAGDPLSQPTIRMSLIQSLQGGKAKALRQDPDEIQSRVIALAEEAMGKASEAASLSLRFFPPIVGPYLDLIPEKAQDAAWWKEVGSRFQSQARDREAYLAHVEGLFRNLGQAIREVSSSEASLLPSIP